MVFFSLPWTSIIDKVGSCQSINGKFRRFIFFYFRNWQARIILRLQILKNFLLIIFRGILAVWIKLWRRLIRIREVRVIVVCLVRDNFVDFQFMSLLASISLWWILSIVWNGVVCYVVANIWSFPLTMRFIVRIGLAACGVGITLIRIYRMGI